MRWLSNKQYKTQIVQIKTQTVQINIESLVLITGLPTNKYNRKQQK
jgi:hypothetical protein